ncbi:urease accessory protein UreD [Aquisalimonas asiatica]|uniref:urease accessory protein UreD n=1 Tax=Aquisalimonas asiatica TaxID=406100 RepID=UPI001FE0A894|nr:urease accessory protein UreD [Aquisalimonas asiatica]
MDGWLGRLALRFAQRGDRTVLTDRRHEGPLLVQRTFHPEGPVCHAYLIHPPGGVVGGDQLRLDVDVAPGAHALLTTPAAAKFYRTAGPVAHQEQVFRVEGDGALEFLPMETILHGRSDTVLTNRFQLASESRLCAWDILCLGRPGSGDAFDAARCAQDLVVERDGQVLLHERLNLVSGDALLTRPWGLGGYTTVVSMVVTPAADGLEETLRGALAGHAMRIGVSRIGDLLLLRCLADGAETARAVLEDAWQAVREPVLARAPSTPRIWKT